MMRESLDVFFMKIAMMYATRSTCIRRKVGSVIVKDKIQIGAGYNGAPSGIDNCIDVPNRCIREKLHVKSGEHEELCLTGDNVIKLLDGTYKTIKELAKDEKDVWVYSINEKTGKIIPGLATNIHCSGYRDDIVEVIFDNGKSIKCTSDHLIMMRDCTYKQAKDLQYGDSCMPIYYKFYYDKKGNKGHEYVSNSYRYGQKREINNSYLYQSNEATHHMVYRYIHNFYEPFGKNVRDVHHINENKQDNRPENLEMLTHGEHISKHGGWKKWPKEKLLKMCRKGIEAQREKAKNDPEFAKKRSDIGRKNMNKLWENEEWAKTARIRGRENWRKGNLKSNKDPKAIKSRQRGNIRISLSNLFFKAKQNGEEVTPENYEEMRKKYKIATRLGDKTPSLRKTETILKYYDSLEEAFEDARTNNHKVVQVKKLEGKFPVYDISVPKTNNFAIDLGDNSCVIVHNCFGVHSEINSLVYSMNNGANLKDATIYVTAKPCVNCTKAIVTAGISRIVYFDEYSAGIDNDIANEILKNTQVDILITEELKQFANYLNILRR